MSPRDSHFKRRAVSRRAVFGGLAASSAFVPRAVRAAFNPYLQQHALYLNDGTIFTDGASHPASGLYANIAATRAVYPFATAQTNELNWLIIQKAIYDAGAVGAKVYVGYSGSGSIRLTNSSSASDGSGTLRFGDYGDAFNTGASGNIIFAGEGLGTIFSWPNDLGRPADTGNFTASVSSAGIMTVTVAPSNPIIPGMMVNGTGIKVWDVSGPDANRSMQRVLFQITGAAGGTGTYQLTNTQTAAGSGTFSATFSTVGNPWGRRNGIECGSQNTVFSGWYGIFRDFTMYGPGVGSTLGTTSTGMNGFCTTDRVQLENIQVGYTLGAGTSSGFQAGISLTGGQTRWVNVRSNNNYLGVEMPTQTQEFGNIVFDHCDFASNLRAGFGISPVASLQSCNFIGGNMDTQPYSIWCQPWSSAMIAALGFGPTDYDPQFLTLDCDFDMAQFENIGNALIGDGLLPETLTGSISGTTLTVTGGTPQVGHWLQQAQGGPAIADGTYIIQDLGGGTWKVSVSQTVASGSITATKARYMHRTRLNPAEGLWGGAGYNIASEPRRAMLDIASMDGVIRPMVNFAWTPGTVSIFGFTRLSAAVGIVTPQPGLLIEGDLATLITNCTTGSSFGGHGFFASSTYITPGFIRLKNPGFWEGTVAPTFDGGFPGTPICTLGKVVLRHIAAAGTPVVCTGSASTDDVMGIVIYSDNWPLIATKGEVPVSSGANNITAGQYVRTSSSGDIIAASGRNDTNSVVIGIAIADASGGFTSVRLMGLE